MRLNFLPKAGVVLLAAIFSLQGSTNAQFTPGNVVVQQVGTGSAALSSIATQSYLLEFNTTTALQTTPVSTVLIPVSGSGRLTNSGSATSEGLITRSTDSTKLVVTGYDAATGTTGIASTVSATTNRVIDTVNAAGIIGRAVATTLFNKNNIRSAVKTATEDYWAAGPTNGLAYIGTASVADTAGLTVSTNARVVNIYNGNLYFSTNSTVGTAVGIIKVGSGGLPVTIGQTANQLITNPGASPYGFAVNATETVIYIADDGTTTGGIQKWTLNGTTWSLAYTIPFRSRGLLADFSTTYPTVYATTSNSSSADSLIKVVDSGFSATSYSVTVLAVAPANTAFRGVAFAPVCVPLTVTATGNTPCATGTVTLTTNTSVPNVTYQWLKNGNAITGATSASYSPVDSGSYAVIASRGYCSTKSAATNVTLVPAQPAAIIGTTNICGAATIKYAVVHDSNVKSYTWSYSGTGATITPSGDTASIAFTSTATPGTLSVTATNACGTSAARTAAITMGATPSLPSVISGPSNACLNSATNTYTVVNDPTVTYTWSYSGTGATLTPSGNSVVIAYGQAATAGNISVTATSTCGTSAPRLLAVTLLSVPSQPSAITGNATICQGQTNIKYYVTNDTAVTYNYAYAGSGGTITTTLDTALLNLTKTATSGNLTVTATSKYGCGTSNASSLALTVKPLPAQPSVVTGSITPCQGASTVAYSVVKDTTVTYTWSYSGTGATITPASNTAAISYSNTATSGILTVTATNSCGATARLDTITVSPLPSQPSAITGAATFCAGQTQVYSVTNVTGITYAWTYSGTGATITPTANSASISFNTTATSGNINVTATNTCGTSAPATKAITVNALPQPVITKTGSNLCTGSTFASYAWSLNGTAITGATANCYVATLAGSYTVTVTDANTCTATSPAVTFSVGITNVNGSSDVKVFPNPATSVVNIQAPFQVNVTITNVLGKVVKQENNAQHINISTLANGVYFVAVRDENGVLVKTVNLVKTSN